MRAKSLLSHYTYTHKHTFIHIKKQDRWYNATGEPLDIFNNVATLFQSRNCTLNSHHKFPSSFYTFIRKDSIDVLKYTTYMEI